MHMGGSSGASTSGGVAAESQQQRYAWASAYGYKVAMLRPVEWGLHLVEVLGCLASTLTALRAGAPALALWSLSALATSLASLYVMQRLPATFVQPQLREPWYAALRIHRAFAVVGMRQVLKDPVNLGSRSYFLKSLLVNSSVIPILLQSIIFQLRLPLQALVQVVCAAVAIRAMPAYCAALAADGVPAAAWERLARAFGRLSNLVMSATVTSRKDYQPAEIPCRVSLSYLVVVGEVLLPLLFVWYFDAAMRHWWALRQARAVGGQQGVQEQLQQPAQLAERNGRRGAPAQAGWLHSGPAGSRVWLICAFFLGACGVLWDVAVTINQRWLAAAA